MPPPKEYRLTSMIDAQRRERLCSELIRAKMPNIPQTPQRVQIPTSIRGFAVCGHRRKRRDISNCGNTAAACINPTVRPIINFDEVKPNKKIGIRAKGSAKAHAISKKVP